MSTSRNRPGARVPSRAFLLAATAAVVCGPPAAAEIRTAYLWANRPIEASYAPSAAYVSDSAAGATIQRTGRGRYSVDLAGFLPNPGLPSPGSTPGGGGNVQVSAYGEGHTFCQVVGWTSTVEVACFEPSGRTADSQFVLLATLAGRRDRVAYAWAGRPSEAGYEADPFYAVRDRGAVQVTRREPGVYDVTLGQAAASLGSTVQVTTYGETPRLCQVDGWFLGLVTVSCTDIAGRPADAAFSLLSIRPPPGELDFAFAWANNSSAASYVPDPGYTYTPGRPGGPLVRRSAPGRYTVELDTRLHHVQVSTYGSEGGWCNPVSWSPTTVSVDCRRRGGVLADARFTVLAVLHGPLTDPPPPPDPADEALFGYADLHTHPASFLGFGGRADGRQGMMWGRPAVGAVGSETFRGATPAARYGLCRPDDHSLVDPGIDEIDLVVREDLRRLIIGVADGRTNAPHHAFGGTGFDEWPNSLVVSHQQIDVPWLRRAWQGGLRALVAAAVDNELVDTAYGWTLSDLLPVVDTFFDGRPLRPALGMPATGFAFASARRQLRWIRLMASENPDFMAIATSGRQAREIIAGGRLAVILGLELDNLTPDEILRLVDEDDVRFVTPIHFVDNLIGNAAAYEGLFSFLNGLLGRDGNLYTLAPDSSLDFFHGRELGTAQAAVERLTASALGWGPIGEPCPPTARQRPGGRLGCAGRRNNPAIGLTPAGELLMRQLISRGVLVDVAHMSQAAQEQALEIAEQTACPMMNSHTAVRGEELACGANERAMPQSLAQRLMALGGVIGLGTGTGEYGHPRRIYYNAGNPLIDLRRLRREWRLDLRQPELQQVLAPGRFSAYRVTIRIGTDDLGGSNTLTATLLASDGSDLDTCDLNASGAGASSHTSFTTGCTVSDGRTMALSRVDGLRLQHDAEGGLGADNVDIDEVRLEARVLSDPRGWLTLVQRTGGHEGEVVRLESPAPSDDPAFGSHYWTTRLLPRAEDLLRPREIIEGLRVRTFTNQDDLGGSGPAVLTVGLNGHRTRVPQGGPLRLEFGVGGLPEGTFSDVTLAFPSAAETTVEECPDRAPGLTFGQLTLTTGEEGPDRVANVIADLRDAAAAGRIGSDEIELLLSAALPPLAATGVAAASWALADPLSAFLVGISIWLGIESHDNWSTLVAVDALARGPTASIPRRVPLLVGYNPTQRLKRDEPDSLLFRDLPERIEASRLYGGIEIDYVLTRQDGTKEIPGRFLEFEVVFSDGTRRTKLAAAIDPLPIGAPLRTFISFDRLRPGRELAELVVRALGRQDVLIRSLDVGLLEDPMETWATEFARVDSLGDFPGQIGVGTDLSGFEALVPFSAISPGTERIRAYLDCLRTLTTFCPPFDPIATHPVGASYEVDVELIAGRPDPARSSRGVPARLPTARVDDADSTSRLLDFRESGLSTVGQLPDFAVAAAHADLIRRPTRSELGPRLFRSADALVRAWERLDAARDSGAPPARARCPG